MGVNGAHQNPVIRRHVPEPIDCPRCGQVVPVHKDGRTNLYEVDAHDGSGTTPCPGARIPVPFLPDRYAVVALVFSPEGKVLAVSRKDDPNDLGLPGGKAEDGETPFEAVVREVEEETGLA